MHAEFCSGSLRKRDNLEDLSVDKRVILKRILEKWDGGMEWRDLAQDRDRWKAVAKAVMNFEVHKMREIS